MMGKIIHLVERGLIHPYLCNHAVTPNPEKSTFDPSKVTCKNCLKQIVQGKGFGHKCNYCRNFKYASNRPSYAWCHVEPLPEEVTFNISPYLTMDQVDKGCVSRFEFKRKWKRRFGLQSSSGSETK